MKNRLRSRLLWPFAVLVLAALACGTSLGNDPAPAAEVDQQAIIAAAVATVTAQQPPVPASNPATTITQVDAELQAVLIRLYEQANPSVVHIFSLQGTGTGFVYDEQGHVVTNNHVVADSDVFEVVFADGTRSNAEVVGTDVDSDLAVMRVEDRPASARPLVLGNSRDIQVGQFVVAIGNPFGQQSSMSLGIISGLGRTLRSERGVEGSVGFYSLPEVIQTDAPINPGNSGGPLLNLNGEVVGVNSAINSLTGVNSGVGFSIPVNAVRRIIPALIERGAYTYPFMGVGIQSLNLALQEQLGLTNTRGALVTNVNPGQPAAEAGLRQGDVIIALDGVEVVDSDALISYLVFETEVGQTIEVTFVRDGETRDLPLTLGERP